MFLYIVRKELEKTFAKVTNKFQIDTSILTTTLVGAGKKVLRKILTNGQTEQGNTQKYQFYQQREHIVIYLLNLFQRSH